MFMTRFRLLVFATIVVGCALVYFRAASSPSRLNRSARETSIERANSVVGSTSLIRADRSSTSSAPSERDVAALRANLIQAIAEAEERTDPARYEMRARTWQQLTTSFHPQELGSVFRELNAIQLANPTDSGRDLLLRILQRYSEYDARAAAAALTEMPADDRSEACERVATQWVRQSLGDAMEWTLRLSEAGDRQGALIGIAAEAVSDHPAEVLALASEIPLPPERHDIIAQAASCWTTSDPKSAVNWAAQISDSALREEVLAAVAVAMADRDTNAAARLAIDSLPPGPGQENAVMGIVQRLASQDMEGTKTWVAQFPRGPLRERAETELKRFAEQR